MGAHGRGAAGLRRGLAVHLTADDQLPLDYDSHFPAGYEEGRTSGLRLLRVAARARAEHGRAAVGRLYEAVSSEIFDSPGAAGLAPAVRGSRAFVEPLLATAGLPAGLAGALDDTRWDDEIRIEGDEALTLTGRDVGTPIIQFSPPEGTAFFGPVISRLPAPEERRPALGPCDGPGRLSRLRRAQAEPARAAPAAQLRRRRGHGRDGGGLARRQPQASRLDNPASASAGPSTSRTRPRGCSSPRSRASRPGLSSSRRSRGRHRPPDRRPVRPRLVADTPGDLPSRGRHDASPLRCRAGLPDGGLTLVQDLRRVLGDLG